MEIPEKNLITKCKYVEVEEKMNDKMSVWHYFLRSEDKKLGKCKEPMCQAIIRSDGGTTTGLMNHLNSKHKIDLRKMKKEMNPKEELGSDPAGASKPKQNTIQGYLGPNKKKTLAEVVSKMVAKDGLTFNVFEKSEELRESLKARGYAIPKTAKSFKQMVIRYSKEVRLRQKGVIKELISKGDRFCVTFDEWTSLRNRRYISLILHGTNSQIWNLGLVRIRRSLTSEKCLSLVEKRLQEYDISMKDHIVCILTDGTSVMTKIAKIGPAYQQLCYAHGIQLAVIDVLYKKVKKVEPIEVDNEENDKSDDEEDEEEEENFDTEGGEECGAGAVITEGGVAKNSQDEENIVFYDKDDGDCDDFQGFGLDDDTFDFNSVELSEYVKPLIDKVRKISKMFRRSPKKNEVLQAYVKADSKKDSDREKELNLLLDTKIRWSSLAIMLKRFYDIRNCVKKALVDIKIKTKISFEEWEDELLSEIVNSLEPIKAAVEALCRRDSNLITADATIIFTLKTLKEQNTQLSLELFEAIHRRMKQRRTILSSILQFLHTNSDSAINDSDMELSWTTDADSDADVTEMFKVPSKSKIEAFIKEILLRLSDTTKLTYPHEEARVEEISTAEKKKKKKKNKSELQKNLDECITKAMSVSYADKVKTDKATLTKIVKQELALFQNVGNRGFYLSKVYDYLLMIKPTSVESERAFSSAGYFCNKLRSKMNDDTLDHLCSLRTFFQQTN